jgi:predicted dehydrogenase
MPLRIGILGLGSVFWTPYGSLLNRLTAENRVRVTAAYDPDGDKCEAARRILGLEVADPDAESLIGRDDVDVVLVLTSAPEHGRLGLAALRAGKHVLIEKPMATELSEAGELLAESRSSAGLLVCAPHTVLSPTYREMHRRINGGVIGRPLLARARYGWSGPWWGKWFYQPGGGALFDLGMYNLTSLCGFLGSVRRVTAMVGAAIPDRVIAGERIPTLTNDNAHVLLDFGDARFGSIMTGFTIQRYRSPAIEVYGPEGVLQLMGDDWAPQGFEQWRNAAGVWEIVPEVDPVWPWTDGLRHLIDCVETGRPTVTRPEHAYHALEVMLAATLSSREGRAVEVRSEFPPLDYSSLPPLPVDDRAIHDPRSVL